MCPDGQVCDPDTGACVSCIAKSDCDDGVFCNGEETCGSDHNCHGGTAPDCNDGVNCTDDSCDEVNDQCVNTPNDALCDNGEFCDGVEVCVDGECADGPDPCAANETCDEDNNECIVPDLPLPQPFCPNDAWCEDGDPCTDDTCVDNDGDEVSDACEHAAIECDDDEVCVDGECQQCSEDADCDGGDTCSEGVCVSEPPVGDPVRPPGGVSASNGAYTGRVHLTWDSVLGAEDYMVYRCTSASESTCTEVSSWQSETSFDDTAVDPGTRYWYRVICRDDDGESAYSEADIGYARAESGGGGGGRSSGGCGAFGVGMILAGLGLLVVRFAIPRNGKKRGNKRAG